MEVVVSGLWVLALIFLDVSDGSVIIVIIIAVIFALSSSLSPLMLFVTVMVDQDSLSVLLLQAITVVTLGHLC